MRERSNESFETRLRYVIRQLEILRADVDLVLEREAETENENEAQGLSNRCGDLEVRIREIVMETETETGMEMEYDDDGDLNRENNEPENEPSEQDYHKLDEYGYGSITCSSSNTSMIEDEESASDEDRCQHLMPYFKRKIITIKPYNENEFLLYCGRILNLDLSVKLFRYERMGEDKIQYKAEYLLSIEEYKNSIYMEDHMYIDCKYLLDSCCALYWIHEAGYVHSDISPDHIKYSEALALWKVIDFSQSMKIEESANTSRPAGTEGFRHPRCVDSGIFTPATDIYSLLLTYHSIFSLRNPNPYFDLSGNSILDKFSNPEKHSLFEIIADLLYIYRHYKPAAETFYESTVNAAREILKTDKEFWTTFREAEINRN